MQTRVKHEQASHSRALYAPNRPREAVCVCVVGGGGGGLSACVRVCARACVHACVLACDFIVLIVIFFFEQRSVVSNIKSFFTQRLNR